MVMASRGGGHGGGGGGVGVAAAVVFTLTPRLLALLLIAGVGLEAGGGRRHVDAGPVAVGALLDCHGRRSTSRHPSSFT